LKRAIQKLVIDPLASELLAGRFHAGDVIVCDWDAAAERMTFARDIGKEAAA
jgi:ATP-dependent Clp protease ATP-binding subunit ClpA